MESFLRHSTNLSFEKMLQQEQAERDNLFSSSFAHINEAANTSFDKIIDETLQPNERKVFGTYALKPKSFALTIDRRDQKSFIKLFKKAPDKTVGNGEISLYWLFLFIVWLVFFGIMFIYNDSVIAWCKSLIA
mgnify:CR=1 FL=1